jgi:multimeric flavodoxin WrbA
LSYYNDFSFFVHSKTFARGTVFFKEQRGCSPDGRTTGRIHFEAQTLLSETFNINQLTGLSLADKLAVMTKTEKSPLVLGIGFSPRKGGNSDRLLEWALAGAKKAGARTKKIFARDFFLLPCLSCRACERTGKCPQKDDFNKISKLMDRADIMVVATPVYFLGIPGQAKNLIDRCQTYWSKKYLLKVPPKRSGRPGLLLMTAGSKGKNAFEGTVRTIRAFWDVTGFKSAGERGVEGVDETGAVDALPSLKEEIVGLGKIIAGRSVGDATRPRPN